MGWKPTVHGGTNRAGAITSCINTTTYQKLRRDSRAKIPMFTNTALGSVAVVFPWKTLKKKGCLPSVSRTRDLWISTYYGVFNYSPSLYQLSYQEKKPW
jgi:hypothetical protein